MTVIAWDRAEAGLVADYDFVQRYSKQHIVRGGADHALCGSRIPWMFISSGDSIRCERCFRIAESRGYRDEYGEPIQAEPDRVEPITEASSPDPQEGKGRA